MGVNSQNRCKHICICMYCLSCLLSTCTQTLRKPDDCSPGHPWSPSGLSQTGCLCRWFPRICALVVMPNYKDLGLKTESYSCFLLTLLTSLPFSASPSSTAVLSSFMYFFFCVHCSLQQLLDFTYLGSPLTCCLLELHIVSRDIG